MTKEWNSSDFISARINDGEELKIPTRFGRYEYVKMIGSGAFSIVALVRHRGTLKLYACKICSRQILLENNSFDRFEQEVRTLQMLKHPNLVSLEDVVFDENLIYLIMEYCSNGELFKYIVDQGKMDENLARRIFIQVIKGLQYVHSKDIAHRDIKPENILLDDDLNAKIADFGLCHATSGKLLLKTPCGSPYYAPPEVIMNEEYDGKLSDIWSVGVVLFTMVTGSLPWRETNQTALFSQIGKAEYSVPRYVSKNCSDLIYSLMKLNPTERLTINEIMDHPWLKETDDLLGSGLMESCTLSPKSERDIRGSKNSRKNIVVRPHFLGTSISASASTSQPLPFVNPVQVLLRKAPKNDQVVQSAKYSSVSSPPRKT